METQQTELPDLDNNDSFSFKRKNPKKKKSGIWGYILGIPVVLVFAFFAGLGVLEKVGFVPSLEVLPGDKISADNKALLLEKGILMDKERIDWFYSAGIISIMEDGNILTDSRVVSYETRDEKLNIYALNLEDITEINRVEKGDILTDTNLEIYNKDGDGLRLYLSAEKGGDQKFIDDLLQRTQLPLIEAPLEEAPATDNTEPGPSAG